MEKVLNFISENIGLLTPIFLFIVGIFVPKEKVFSLGKRAGGKLPEDITIKLAEYLDNIEKGLLDSTHNGSKDIVSNEQVTEVVKKAKIDLGLEESGSVGKV